MLELVLGVDEAGLKWNTIQALIDRKVQEHQRLDYKRESPKKPEDFAKTLAAMANGGGGIIILGVVDENDRPVAISPVALTEVSRLQQVFAAYIHPYIRLRFHAIEAAPADGTGIVVIEVPASERVPFAVIEDHFLKYLIRIGQHRQPMTEAEVERMYRERLRRRTEVDARLDQLSGVSSVNRPSRLTIAAVPTSDSARLFHPTMETIRAIETACRSWIRVTSLEGGDLIFRHVRPDFRRLEFHHDYRNITIGRLHLGWVEYHDDGAFVGTIQPNTSDRSSAAGGDIQFIQERLVILTMARLASYWTLSRHFSFVGEVALRARLSVGKSAALIPDPKSLLDPNAMAVKHYNYGIGRALSLDVQTDLQLGISDLTSGPRLVETAKLLLDDIYTAFGWPECLQLGRHGTLNARPFGQSWRSQIAPWTERYEISWTAEDLLHGPDEIEEHED